MPSIPFQPATSSLVKDAISIWQSGVAAVTPESLMQRKIHRDENWLIIDDQCEIDLSAIDRLIVVGAGKASAAMAVQFAERVCQDSHYSANSFPGANSHPKLCGWINAPEGSFATNLSNIHLHAARPAGSNLPTQQAIQGTQQILQLVSSATARDVVVCLISGGGSALLVSPQPGLTLADKQAVSQVVAAAGGNIVQLNTIRRCISQVKGGGLARACKAGRLISLIISDVLGDPLDIIASGPTIVSGQPDCAQAIQILRQLGLEQHPELQNVVQWLTRNSTATQSKPSSAGPLLENIVLGNLADAVDAAGVRAVYLGYRYVMQVAREPESDVAYVAEDAVANLMQLQSQTQIDCWISGGEPTVRLPASNAGKGGRNQQLALSVLKMLSDLPAQAAIQESELVFLSGGTDGEDGPTDAAGAWIDSSSLARAQQLGLNASDYLLRADAYHFFEQLGGLLLTGSTGTNVCDLRVGLCRKKY